MFSIRGHFIDDTSSWLVSTRFCSMIGAKLTFADIAPEVAGVYPAIMQNGELDAGAWSCGMVAGLIRDVPTCKELIDRIMAQAHEIIRGRLARLV